MQASGVMAGGLEQVRCLKVPELRRTDFKASATDVSGTETEGLRHSFIVLTSPLIDGGGSPIRDLGMGIIRMIKRHSSEEQVTLQWQSVPTQLLFNFPLGAEVERVSPFGLFWLNLKRVSFRKFQSLAALPCCPGSSCRA